jgi:hypothetical protein
MMGREFGSDISGQGAVSLANFQRENTRFFPLEDEEGKSYQQVWKFNKGRWEDDETRILTGAAGFEEKWKWRIKELQAQARYGRDRLPTLTPLMGEVDGRRVPLSNLGGRFYYQDTDGSLKAYLGEHYDMREPSGRIEHRDLGFLTGQEKLTRDTVGEAGNQLAVTLNRIDPSVMPTKSVYNRDSGRLNEGAYSEIVALMRSGKIDTMMEDLRLKGDPNYQLLRQQYDEFATQHYIYDDIRKNLRETAKGKIEKDREVIATENKVKQEKIIEDQEAYLDDFRSTIKGGNTGTNKYRFYAGEVSKYTGIPIDEIKPEHIEFLTPSDLLSIQMTIERVKGKK